MSINQQQYEQLTEMGISLWQLRNHANQSETASDNSKVYLDINLSELAQKQLFRDILLATKLSIGEISHQGDHLDFGLFNWYFTDDTSTNEIRWHEQQLCTPSITSIAKSPMLKKQLWQVLSNHNGE
eukprot:TRINITY_DN8706_c0_g1_i1.p1 TRINITY_DN8706_c0_g1~~TRINITY_DN8706_c0_g1_i1.p1  ORF type:complete len:127 (+),score=24.58 TRINITY_DN8706_c0_g1_i1:66-446(+)